eukprot:6010009-Prymnesium_polylepis.1
MWRVVWYSEEVQSRARSSWRKRRVAPSLLSYSNASQTVHSGTQTSGQQVRRNSQVLGSSPAVTERLEDERRSTWHEDKG